MRKVAFENGGFYHIFNRGVDKREVFSCDADYFRFLKSLREFNQIDPLGSLYEKYLRDKKDENGGSTSIMEVEPPPEPLVEIICYCLNPNHYHFILKQVADKGIEKFMQRMGTAYTMFFNKKYKRSGALFQGRFKSVYIDSNEYLLYLSAYVNKNNFIHGYSKSDWKYSSLLDYIGKRKGGLCKKDEILKQFRSVEDYKEFLESNAVYLKEKKEAEKYLLE